MLQTLRRVSFLSVSWAHHADPSVASNVFSSSSSPTALLPPVGPPRSLSAHAQSHPSGGSAFTSPVRIHAERPYLHTNTSKQARMRSSTDPQPVCIVEPMYLW